MLGWNISVYRQQDGGASPASFGAARGARLAVWQTGGYDGLNWIKELLKHQKAIGLGGNGYPLEFTAMTKYLKTSIIDGPPCAREAWAYGPRDVLLDYWEGKTNKNIETLNTCRPDEWLLIQAWDES